MASTTLPTVRARPEYNIASPLAFVGDPTVANGDGILKLGRIQAANVSLNPSKQMASDVGPQQLAAAAFDRGVDPEVSLTLHDAQARVITAMMESAKIPDAEASVVGVDTSSDTITVSGDATSLLATGDIFTVTGSTGNDGEYTVDSTSYDSTNDDTTITVKESVDDGTANGKAIGFIEGMLFRNDIRKIDPKTLILVPQGKEQHAIEQPGVWHFPAVVDTGVGDHVFEDSDGEDANSPVDYTLRALQREQDQAGQTLPNGARVVFTVPPGRVPGANLDWYLPGNHGQS
jgi:hypothetical protein